MTIREQEILDLITDNPLISQIDIATKLNITRSSVGVHISNLVKKGYIQGKGYILRTSPYICVIGGANIDIQGFPENQLIQHDSNPGKVELSLGGVGRNIAENLTKLKIDTNLITVLGDDFYADRIINHSKEIGLTIHDSMLLKDKNTSIYLSILDKNKDMNIAIASMDIFDFMDIEFIKTKKNLISNSRLCIIDTNIPKETIEFIVTNFTKTNFFLDTVSTTKAKKIKDLIGFFHTIKPNKLEAEILSGIKINSNDDLEKIGNYFIGKGVQEVFITLGKDGVFYKSKKSSGIINIPEVNVINATGAGDAFLAGLAYAHFNSMKIKDSAVLGIGASIQALSHRDTINPNISYNNIIKTIEEMKIC